MKALEPALSIMIVDDDDDDVLLMSHALKKHLPKTLISTCENGAVLLETLQHSQNLPSLILLDLNMHCMDGRETLKALKNNERTQNIPVIILTTSKNEDDVRLTHDLGAATFFIKPQTPLEYSQLVASLTKYLSILKESGIDP